MKHNLAWFMAVAAGALALAPGCITEIHGHHVTPDMVAFIQPGVTTRREVVENLGRPVIDLKQGRAVAYTWEKVRGFANSAPTTTTFEQQRLGMVENPAPLLQDFGSEPNDYAGPVRAYCLAFDAQDRVAKAQFLKFTGTDSLAQQLFEWSKRPASAK